MYNDYYSFRGLVAVEKVRLYGVRKKDSAFLFDDILGIEWEQDGLKETLEVFGTTKPGPSKDTTYNMQAGEYKNLYTIRYLGGRKVFFQVGAVPVKILRKGKVETLTLNPHLNIVANRFEAEAVNKSYRGCQVIQDPRHLQMMVDICEKSKQKFFDYTLTEV